MPVHRAPLRPFAIFDLDGTLVRGGAACQDAHAMVAAYGNRWAIASNNSTHDAESLSQELAEIGLVIPAERIVLAGVATLDLIARERAGARVMLIAGPRLVREAEARAIRCVETCPDIVCVARDPGFTYEKLAAAANAVAAGAEVIATNADLTHPGPGAHLVPETGSLLRAILACASPKHLRIVGKPAPDLFAEALTRLGARARDCVMIGDNAETDGAGARRLGIPFLPVGAAAREDGGDSLTPFGHL